MWQQPAWEIHSLHVLALQTTDSVLSDALQLLFLWPSPQIHTKLRSACNCYLDGCHEIDNTKTGAFDWCVCMMDIFKCNDGLHLLVDLQQWSPCWWRVSPGGTNTITVTESAQYEAVGSKWHTRSPVNRPMFSLSIQSVSSMYNDSDIYR